MPYKKTKTKDEILEMITNNTCKGCPLRSFEECKNCVYSKKTTREYDDAECEEDE